ncbi:putative phosphoheptose isomerase [Mycobacterium xenopi 3993]|nr:putative phosphoheptose isomerase [Mycobacterium xenopi 3993]
MTAATNYGIDAGLAADLACASLALARRFSAGGTMWSMSPSWAPHALHIAVEFIHPVVVGKRALPAVALSGPDLVDVARVSVSAGDIVVAVANADDPQVGSVMRRAPAWGATTIWMGSGPARRSVRLIMCYGWIIRIRALRSLEALSSCITCCGS